LKVDAKLSFGSFPKTKVSEGFLSVSPLSPSQIFCSQKIEMLFTTFTNALLKFRCVNVNGGIAQMCTTVQTTHTPRTLDPRVTVAERQWDVSALGRATAFE
jgi:hypothetical protein